MAKARARQTDNRVSMEAVTSLSGRRKELASRQGGLTALRAKLQTADKPTAIATLHQIRKDHGPMEYEKALKLINPTYLGIDVIPEKIADGPSKKRK
jgi:hypothetical protein